MILDQSVKSYGALPIQVYKVHTLQGVRGIKYPVVFIHGGAWRDRRNTCNDFDKLVGYIDKQLGEGPAEAQLFSLNYRLSPEFKHPVHLEDTLRALSAIKSEYGVEQIALCGHSVGSTLITQILESGSRYIPTVRHAVFLDGIYNVNSMISEYPEYEDFVGMAFNNKEYLTKCNMISSGVKGEAVKSVYSSLDRIIIVHSLTDELLSPQQPEEFLNWLLDSGVPEQLLRGGYYMDDYGKHNDVYQNESVAKVITESI